MNSGDGQSFNLPQSWEDDVRMNSLFAPFRPRAINPVDWDSKMTFWTSLIEEWCTFYKAPLLRPSHLPTHFRRKGKTPSCLTDVVNHLCRTKTLVPKDDFYQMMEQNWVNWAVNILITKNPVSWTLGKVKNTIIGRNSGSEAMLVHLPTIKKLGQELIQKVPEEQKGKLIDVAVIEEVSGITDREVLRFILHYLFSQKLIVLKEDEIKIHVKFPKSQSEKLAITEVDKALFHLEQNKGLLEKDIARLENEREKLLSEAKKYVSLKNTVMAKSSLRRKKGVEIALEKISGAADNIDALIHRLQMTEMDSVILDSYQSGVKTLNNYFKENGLTKERAESTREELEETLSYASDIDGILSRSVSDESDGSDELNELIKLMEDEKAAEARDKPALVIDSDSLISKLPDVPLSTPSESVDESLEKKLAGLAI